MVHQSHYGGSVFFKVMNMLKKTIFSCVLTAIGLVNTYAANGIQIAGTRLVYDGSKSQASINISNPDDRVYLIQSWVTKDPKSTKAADDLFITTPPLFRLEAGTDNSVRVVYNGKTLPNDRESVYWLNIKSIPSTQRKEENVLLIAVKTQIKLFYRPANLQGNPAEAYKKLKFLAQNGQLAIKNPTPYSVSLKSLKVNGTEVVDPPMILPFTTELVDKHVSAGAKISWQAINDFGGITPEEKAIAVSQ